MSLNHLLFFAFFLCLGISQSSTDDHANKNALKLVDILPRYGDEKDLQKNTDLMQYAIGLAPLVAIPLLFVILTILVCPLWCCCRCLKCFPGCRKTPPLDKITNCKMWGNYVFILLCCAVMVAMGGLAYQANKDFSNAILYNQGEGANSNLFKVTDDLFVDGVAKLDSIINLTLPLKDTIKKAVNDTKAILNDTTILSSGTNTLINMLDDISNLWADYTITVNYNINGVPQNATYACDFCTTIATETGNVKTDIEQQTGPIFEDLNNTVNSIENDLYNMESDITSEIDSFADTLNGTSGDLNDTRSDVIEFKPDVETINDQRELAYNILFAMPFIPIVFVLFGGLFKRPMCFTGSYICLWWSCFLMFFLLAIHLPIAVVLNDSCKFIDLFEANVTHYIEGKTGDLIQSCLDNTKLVDVLGLGDDLNFTNKINFPSLGNIADNFTFDSLTSFESDAVDTDFSTFYASGDAALILINSDTGDYWDRSNISNLNATAYYPSNPIGYFRLLNWTTIVLTEQSTIPAFNNTLKGIRKNLSDVSVQASIISNNTQKLVNSVDDAKEQVLEDLFANVDDIIDEARCGFVGDAYRDATDVMCQTVLGALSRIVVCMFIVALLSMISCCCSIKLVRRTEYYNKQKREDRDRLTQQQFKPDKPALILSQPHSTGTGKSNAVHTQGFYFNSHNV